MEIQTLVVFIVITIAMTVGILAGTLGIGARPAGWLVIGLVPGIWTLLYVIKRVIGQEIWHYTAPYPEQLDAVNVSD